MDYIIDFQILHTPNLWVIKHKKYLKMYITLLLHTYLKG